jgi:hypothetical protein
LIRDFKNAKKFDLIYGKELKSVVIKGRLLEKIISSRLDRKLESITGYSFSNTTVNKATNSCYFVYGIQFLKSSNNVPRGTIMLFRI